MAGVLLYLPGRNNTQVSFPLRQLSEQLCYKMNVESTVTSVGCIGCFSNRDKERST